MSDYRIETKCIQSGYETGKGRTESTSDLSEHYIYVMTSSEQMGRLFDLRRVGIFLYASSKSDERCGCCQNMQILEGGYSGDADIFRTGGEFLCRL